MYVMNQQHEWQQVLHCGLFKVLPVYAAGFMFRQQQMITDVLVLGWKLKLRWQMRFSEKQKRSFVYSLTEDDVEKTCAHVKSDAT